MLSTALSLAAAAVITSSSRPAAAEPGSLGVMVDAGVPDGLTGSLVFRPLSMLHVHGGVGTNLISYGVRGGASLYLLPFAISPSLNAEVGRYFAGNANDAAYRVGLTDEGDMPLLREVGYDYANLHLGLDIGRERLSFYIHAGMSAVRGKVKNLGELIAEDADEDLTFEVNGDPTVRLVTPSARLGLLFFF